MADLAWIADELRLRGKRTLDDALGAAPPPVVRRFPVPCGAAPLARGGGADAALLRRVRAEESTTFASVISPDRAWLAAGNSLGELLLWRLGPHFRNLQQKLDDDGDDGDDVRARAEATLRVDAHAASGCGKVGRRARACDDDDETTPTRPFSAARRYTRSS